MDVVRPEPHHLLPQPIVDLHEPGLHWLQFVDRRHLSGFTNGAEAAGILRYHAHPLRRNVQHGELVIAADVLDGAKVILGRHLADRDQLGAVFLAVRRVHEQVAETLRPLAVAHRFAQVLDVILVEGRVVHRQDEAGMTAVGEVLAPEQRGRLIQQRAMQAARAEWKRLQRGTATLSYTLTKGRPELIPDQTYSLTGIKAEIAAIVWLGGNIRHSFTPDAVTTSLDLESQLPDGDDIAGLANENAGYTGVLAWYRDANTGQQHKLTEGNQANPRRLTHLYESKASAQRAVKREFERLAR